MPRGPIRETGSPGIRKEVRYLITETDFSRCGWRLLTPACAAERREKKLELTYISLLVQSPAAPVGANLTCVLSPFDQTPTFHVSVPD